MKPKQILLYQSLNDSVKVEVTFDKGNFWLSQKAIAGLFGVKIPAISKNLKYIFESRELDIDSVISKMEITASDNKVYETIFYRFDAVFAVGYRVNSVQATQFSAIEQCN